MKTLELTQDACKLIAEALKSQIKMWQERNKSIIMHGVADFVPKIIEKNNTKIGELKTLLNYINS